MAVKRIQGPKVVPAVGATPSAGPKPPALRKENVQGRNDSPLTAPGIQMARSQRNYGKTAPPVASAPVSPFGPGTTPGLPPMGG